MNLPPFSNVQSTSRGPWLLASRGSELRFWIDELVTEVTHKAMLIWAQTPTSERPSYAPHDSCRPRRPRLGGRATLGDIIGLECPRFYRCNRPHLQADYTERCDLQ